MTKQVEAVTTSNRARVYAAIKGCFDALPSRFKAGELERLAGFNTNPMHRMLVAMVLRDSFKCRQVGRQSTAKFWVKP